MKNTFKDDYLDELECVMFIEKENNLNQKRHVDFQSTMVSKKKFKTMHCVNVVGKKGSKLLEKIGTPTQHTLDRYPLRSQGKSARNNVVEDITVQHNSMKTHSNDDEIVTVSKENTKSVKLVQVKALIKKKMVVHTNAIISNDDIKVLQCIPLEKMRNKPKKLKY